MSQNSTALIVDDHPMITEGLSLILKNVSFVKQVHVVHKGKDAVDFIANNNNTSLVMLDINLPDTDGIELCKELLQLNKSLKILAISIFNDNAHISQMLEAGASGYLLKNASQDEILDAVTAIFNDKIYLNQEVASIIFAAQKEKAEIPLLTKREKEILKLVARGLTSIEIASQLHISNLTVDTHRKSLLYKLKVKNTSELISKATKLGMF